MPPVPGDHPSGRSASAGVYDCWLGGEDHLPAEEALARRIEAVCPAAPAAARRNRQFLERAVTWAARRGIAQFFDLGSGYPVTSSGLANTHETARAVIPSASAVYADISADVASHCEALLAGPGVAAVRADLRDPAALLARRAVRQVTDMGRPACIVLGLVLGWMPAWDARDVVAGYARLAAPGSAVVISVARTDDEDAAARVAEVTGGAFRNHSREEVAGFLGGLDVIAPGLVPVRAWRGGMPDPGLRPDAPAHVIGAVARVPG